MKAARNARFRLIPGNVRAQVIATARTSGQARVVERGRGRNDGTESQPRSAQPTSERRSDTPAAGPVSTAEVTKPRVPEREVVSISGPYAPTEKQVAFFRRLADSPVFTDQERTSAFEWLAKKATRQTIKDQIDWLKRQVETRRGGQTGDSAA